MTFVRLIPGALACVALAAPRRQTMRSQIEPMKKIARSLHQHRELILNYFRAKSSSPAGYHSLHKLPEPESTHDFF